ncbi:MAG TPA: ABC transporter substrate-binding protein [Candidatus Binatia bacterium]|nr:ABC transporter substrate-binding protein [Candidatus Binatia bacterium]
MRFTTLIACILILISAAAVYAQPKDLTRIELTVFRLDAGTAVAHGRGYFAQERLDVKATITGSSTEQMRGLSQGKFQIATGGFDNVLAWSGKEGAEIVAVAKQTESPSLTLFARPEIKKWEDLGGKKLAADAVDTAYALVLRKILLAHGLDFARGDYQLIGVGATPNRLESMIKGETFASILSPPVDHEAEAAGMVKMAHHREVLPDYPGSSIIVTRRWAESHRAELVSFLRARNAAVAWAKDPANRDAAITVVADTLKIGREDAANRLDELATDGALNIAGLKNVLDLRVQFGFKLPMGNTLEKYYDESYFREAAGK